MVGWGGTSSTAEQVPTHGATLWGKGPLLRGSAHAACLLPALLSGTKRRGPGSGCPAANREGLCASWQELGRARRCWLGAGRAPGQSGLRSWAGSAASTFLGPPGSGTVCGRRASARRSSADPPAARPGRATSPGQPRPRGVPGHAPASRGRCQAGPPARAGLPAQHCPRPGCSPGSCCAGTVPACRPLLGLGMASPGALPLPKAPAPHWVQPGNQSGIGTGRVRGWEKRRMRGSPLSPSTQSLGMHLC